jgi:LuxR family maltose regulon positive regulatory protein
MGHAQAAGDDVLAARLFAAHGPRQYQLGRLGVVQAWIGWFERRDLLPAHPAVAILGAVFNSVVGDPTAAERLADLVDETRQDVPLPPGVTLAGWAAGMRAVIARRGLVQAIADADLAMRELACGASQRAPAAFYGAYARLMLGELEEADKLFDLVVETATTFERPAVSAAHTGRAMVAIGRRDWRAASAFSARSREELEASDAGDHIGSVGIFAVASRVASHRGDRKEAAALAARAQRLRPLCSRAFVGSAPSLLQLAHAHVELADPAGARSVLRQLRDIQLSTLGLGIVGEQADELQATLSSMGTGTIGVTSLTTSELRVLPFLATHLTLREIADRLYLSRHTVKTHALSIYRKVGASSRAEAVERLSAAGLLDGSGMPR